MSPNMRQLTLPLGKIIKYVNEQLKMLNLNQASGGSCNALQKKYRITLPWQTIISNSCFSSSCSFSFEFVSLLSALAENHDFQPLCLPSSCEAVSL